jgi:membrane associated rhomboid family serine protease
MKITAVRVLIALNVLVYVVQRYVFADAIEANFALWPLQPVDGAVNFQPWQIISYAFLHDPADIAHLLLNMWGLWMFGEVIERYVGPRRLLAVYFASVVTAALAQLLVPFIVSAPPEPTIGASGGVFGLLLAYAMMFPKQKLLVFFVLPAPAWLVVAVFALIELLLGVTGTQSDVAHFAHLGGLIGSALVVLQWRRARSAKTR